MNRGIARRTLFETERDIRFFLSRVARTVRAGELEIHAFSVLTTHFHMLVRSPRGRLAVAMQKIQNEYTRWFNRSRRRDGTLYRSRYRSRAVRALAYRQILVRYIDANAVSAGLVPEPRLYPHGSARWYARPSGPVWLCREWVESSVRVTCEADRYRAEDYPHTFGPSLSPRVQRLVERRLDHASDAEDALDNLLDAATHQVIEWMRRKATLADGTAVGLPISDCEDVQELIACTRATHGAWTVQASQKAIDAWTQVQVALLRDMCGATFSEAGIRTRMTEGGAWKLYQRHRSCIAESEEYAHRVAVLAEQLLARLQVQRSR